MGQSLSEPKTEKQSSAHENEFFSVGVSSMQGWRVSMEDAHTVKFNFGGKKDAAFFGVYDGHGGHKFAEYCSQHLHETLKSDRNFRSKKYEVALKNTFLGLDKKLHEDKSVQLQFEPGGTTANVVLVVDGMVYCSNVGDSRAVASINGNAHELSHDHKPSNPVEESRIYKAGGWIDFNRVNGNLALSRAIGDFNFKEKRDFPPEDQVVTANPDVTSLDISSDLEFVVVACDGIWDVMSNQEVVDFVRRRISEKMKLETICEALLDHCLAPDCRMGGVGCDNMTAIVACFLHGRSSYNDLAARFLRDIVMAMENHAHHQQRRRSSSEIFAGRRPSDDAGGVMNNKPVDSMDSFYASYVPKHSKLTDIVPEYSSSLAFEPTASISRDNKGVSPPLPSSSSEQLQADSEKPNLFPLFETTV